MALFGKITFILGLIVTIVTLIGGFWLLFDNQDDYAQKAFMIVPIAMLVTFVGLSTIVLFSPRDMDNK